ncbi:hypothetical protein J6590_008671 [Homalodisca vitripennis]|nr:hypothetical protein J6590_008671 [Homalodisca vitripennis]
MIILPPPPNPPPLQLPLQHPSSRSTLLLRQTVTATHLAKRSLSSVLLSLPICCYKLSWFHSERLYKVWCSPLH